MVLALMYLLYSTYVLFWDYMARGKSLKITVVITVSTIFPIYLSIHPSRLSVFVAYVCAIVKSKIRNP